MKTTGLQAGKPSRQIKQYSYSALVFWQREPQTANPNITPCMSELTVSPADCDQQSMDTPSGIVEWLEEFAAKVRAIDFEGGRKLFRADIFGFGTKAGAYRTLDEWDREQWRHVWPKTTGFQFNLRTLRTVPSRDGSLCCVACEWGSDGIREDGSRFPRRGRCTILLSRNSDHEWGWIGVHSHFSMPPQVN